MPITLNYDWSYPHRSFNYLRVAIFSCAANIVDINNFLFDVQIVRFSNE